MFRALLAHHQELENCKCSLRYWHAVFDQSHMIMASVGYWSVEYIIYIQVQYKYNYRGTLFPTIGGRDLVHMNVILLDQYSTKCNKPRVALVA